MVAIATKKVYLYYVDSGFTHYRYSGSHNAICLSVNTILSGSEVRD